MLEKIIELTADTLGANAAEITAETSFMDDLHADSLDLFELAMALEEEFSVEIPSEDLDTDHNRRRCNELPDRASGMIINL